MRSFGRSGRIRTEGSHIYLILQLKLDYKLHFTNWKVVIIGVSQV